MRTNNIASEHSAFSRFIPPNARSHLKAGESAQKVKDCFSSHSASFQTSSHQTALSPLLIQAQNCTPTQNEEELVRVFSSQCSLSETLPPPAKGPTEQPASCLVVVHESIASAVTSPAIPFEEPPQETSSEPTRKVASTKTNAAQKKVTFQTPPETSARPRRMRRHNSVQANSSSSVLDTFFENAEKRRALELDVHPSATRESRNDQENLPPRKKQFEFDPRVARILFPPSADQS